jgi:hypothetical protein
MSPKRVEDTPSASKEALSGHMNYDFTAPSVPAKYKTPGPGRLREADADSHMKAPVVIQDITADKHGSEVSTPDHVGGYPFRVREV